MDSTLTNGRATAHTSLIEQRREQERVDANRELSQEMQRSLQEMIRQYAQRGIWGKGHVVFTVEDGEIRVVDDGFFRTRKRRR